MRYHRLIIGGNLTRDPELRYGQSGTAFCKFGVAINETYKDQQKTVFVNCTAFGKLAEVIAKHLVKGAPFFGEGRLDFSQWEKNGEKRSALGMIVEHFQFVGSKSDDSGGNEGGGIPF